MLLKKKSCAAPTSCDARSLRHHPDAVQRNVAWRTSVTPSAVSGRPPPAPEPASQHGSSIRETVAQYALRALMLCSPGLANSHTDNLTTATETPAATNLQRLQLPNSECAPLPDPVVPQAWACVLDERQPAQNLVRRDLGIEDEEDTSVPATIIGSLQGSKKHDPNLLLHNKIPCCLNQQKEMNRMVQTGATRVHHSARHTTAYYKPRQAQVHLRRLPPTLVTPFISELHDKFCFASVGTLHPSRAGVHVCCFGDCAHSAGYTRQVRGGRVGAPHPLPNLPFRPTPPPTLPWTPARCNHRPVGLPQPTRGPLAWSHEDPSQPQQHGHPGHHKASLKPRWTPLANAT